MFPTEFLIYVAELGLDHARDFEKRHLISYVQSFFTDHDEVADVLGRIVVVDGYVVDVVRHDEAVNETGLVFVFFEDFVV